MDEAEFDEFYGASYRRLTGQVYAMIGNLDEAQDCVQEAFVRAWAHRRKLDRAAHPVAWVRVTAHRLAVSRWRRTKLARRGPDRAIGPTLLAPAPDESHVALVSALRELPEAQRRAIVLYHIAGLPVRAVAAQVGVPEGRIKAWLSRGRAALAALLSDEAPPGGLTGDLPRDLQGGPIHA